MRNYLFETDDGRFFVECGSLEEAWETMRDLGFSGIEYCGAYTSEEADILGYDTF